MPHIERAHSKHTPEQLFDLVADVEQYPEFLPWVIAARVTRCTGNTMWTDLTMGTGFIQKTFTTVAALDKPRRMEINSYDPMFERFEQIWTFDTAADGGTDVEYRVDLKVRSQVLRVLVGAYFTEGTKTMVSAYMRRAQRLYGTSRSSSAHTQAQSDGHP